MEDAITVEVDDAPMHEKTHENNDVNETTLTGNNEGSIVKVQKTEVEETITATAEGITSTTIVMEDAITTVEVDDAPINEKTHENNDMNETTLTENNEGSIIKVQKTEVEETFTATVEDITIAPTIDNTIKDEEFNFNKEDKESSNVVTLQLPSDFNFDDENAVQFVLQQLRMTSSPLAAATTTVDADDVEACSIAPTPTTNNKELSIEEDQEEEVIIDNAAKTISQCLSEGAESAIELNDCTSNDDYEKFLPTSLQRKSQLNNDNTTLTASDNNENNNFDNNNRRDQLNLITSSNVCLKFLVACNVH